MNAAEPVHITMIFHGFVVTEKALNVRISPLKFIIAANTGGRMDKSTLEEYISLLREMEDLERRIRETEQKSRELLRTIVFDTVEGTREDGTYGPIKIKGVPVPAYEEELQRLQAQKSHYERLKREIRAQKDFIEDFIHRVPKSQIRTILRLRYLDGKTWEQVSRKFGQSRTWSQMQVNRFFAKNA